MRAKLSALREGKILPDDEFASILLDNSISVTSPLEEPSLPAGEEVDQHSGEEDDEQLEGENIEDEKSMGDLEDHLIVGLVEQSKEHLSIFPPHNVSDTS
jgi:hypothetical protein